MIPSDIDRVVSAGFEFIRALNELYGAEKSNEIWNIISNSIEPEINRKLCFAMLCQDSTLQVEFRATLKSNRLDIIRALRAAGDFDLATANDISRDSTNKFVTVACNSATSARKLAASLKNNYCLINP
jgi:hypothetical protein